MFNLEFRESSTDVMVQFWYSLDTSTPCFTRFTRPNPHGFNRFDKRLPKYEIDKSFRGSAALASAKLALESINPLAKFKS